MEKLKRVSCAVIVVVAIGAMGCSEPTRPAPPTPPPALALDSKFNTSNDLLPSDEVFDIFVDSQRRLWISTDAGIFMKDDTGDTVFTDFHGLPNRQCRGLAESNGKIFVGTWGGGAAVFDGSAQWIPLPLKQGSQEGLVSDRVFTLAADDTSLWMCTVAGVSQYRNDDALSMDERWVDYTDLIGALQVTSCFTNDDVNRGPEVWFGLQEDGLSVLRLPSILAVSGHSATGLLVFAVGDGGAIMQYDGTEWTAPASPTRGALRGLEVINANAAHAVGDGGTWVSYDGSTWTDRNTPTLSTLNAVSAFGTGDVYAVGDGGAVVRFNGTVHTRLITPFNFDLNGVWVAARNKIYVVGEGGTAITFDGNRTWTDTTLTTEDLNAIWGLRRHGGRNNDDVFAVGDAGTIFHWDGSVWSSMSSGTSMSLNGVWGTSAIDVFAVGENATILHYDGSAWAQMSSGASPNLAFQGVWGDPSVDMLAAGGLATHMNGSDRIFSYDGSAWRPMTRGVQRLLVVERVQESGSGLPGNQVSDMIQDVQVDGVWVSMPTLCIAGVNLDTSAWSHFRQVDGFQSDLALSLDMRANRDLWVGTQAGVSRREPSGRIVNFIKGSGIPDPRVRKVYVDPDDQVWLSFTGAGAARVVDPDTHKN